MNRYLFWIAIAIFISGLGTCSLWWYRELSTVETSVERCTACLAKDPTVCVTTDETESGEESAKFEARSKLCDKVHGDFDEMVRRNERCEDGDDLRFTCTTRRVRRPDPPLLSFPVH